MDARTSYSAYFLDLLKKLIASGNEECDQMTRMTYHIPSSSADLFSKSIPKKSIKEMIFRFGENTRDVVIEKLLFVTSPTLNMQLMDLISVAFESIHMY